MRQSIRALVVVIIALAVVVGCSRASRSTRASSAPPDSGPAVSASSQPAAPMSAAMTAIPGHPPVTTTGVVAQFDPTTGVLIFQDGRAVKVTPQSQVLQPKVMQRKDPAAIRPGDRVVVHNALPIGVFSASSAGKQQRMATVASVDQQKRTVQMTDDTSVRLTPSTNMHKGTDGAAMGLADLRPGDELVIVVTETGAPGPPASTSGSATTGTQPSALPGQPRTMGAPSDPSDASELMVFRETEAP
jgi:hypothetical protein